MRQAFLVAVVLCMGLLGGCRIPSEAAPRATPSASTAGVPTPATSPTSPQPLGQPITLAFAGDVHFEGRLAGLLDQPDGTLGPLSEVLTDADLAMVNLESALTSGGSRAEKELEDPARRYWFRSPPAALDLLRRSGVDLVSVANNHGADYSADGLRDTLTIAATSKVGVIGAGANPAQAHRPHQRTIRGTRLAVFAADASPLESNTPIWNVGADGPGLARADGRLIEAVRRGAANNDVVAVYLHWGEEGSECPTEQQRQLAQSLATAGADVIVGSHAHRLQGAGRLGSAYVSYGLGNFLWYHGNPADTGVLRLTVQDGRVIKDDWVPGAIPATGGQPQSLIGMAARAAVVDWQRLRSCTDLAPLEPSTPAPEQQQSPAGPAAYPASIQPVPQELHRRMIGRSHHPDRCPVPVEELRLLTLGFIDFDDRPQVGQLIVHSDQAASVVQVFGELYAARFPIQQMRLVDDYDGDDDASMAANNTSAYNCRTVAGTSTLSRHSYGRAIDLNPVQNPYVTGAGVLPPAGEPYAAADRRQASTQGLITESSVVVTAFAKVGWAWGGRWADPDYQHFDAGE